MKTKLIITSTLLTLFFTSNAQTWSELKNAPSSWRFDDIYFLNPQKGWAINPYYNNTNPPQNGRVFTTNDAGQTWKPLFDSSKTFIRCVGFSDNLNGWFGNLADTTNVNGLKPTEDIVPFYKTVDGGIHWTPVTNIPNPKPAGICGISIVNDSVVYAYGRYFGPAVLIKTTDKGKTWTSQDMSPYASGLVDAHFFNKDTGFLIGCDGNPKKGLILSTFNGGATWQTRYRSSRNDDEIAWKITFPSRKVGYASIEYVGSAINFPNYIVKTTDGGLTWKEIPFIKNYDVQGIGFVNDSVGWVGGSSSIPFNYKTTNGGSTWIIDSSFGVIRNNFSSGFSINRFRRFGESIMYACGNTIYKYKNDQVSSDIQSNIEHQFKASPNPFSDQIIINSNFLNNNSKIIIYNSNGQLVKEIQSINSESITIKRDNLTVGTYILHLIQNDQIKVIHKLVVEEN